MASAPDRLLGVRAKIKRAKHHISDLEIQLRAFRQANQDCLRTEHDPQTGKQSHRISFRSLIPDSIPLVIGDAVHNLRSALDHLAWQLVEANGHTPDDKTSYPICKAAHNYNKTSTRRKVQGISPAAVQLIEATQAYQSGYDGLGKLSELDNFDKHRMLFVAAFKLGDIGFGADLAGLVSAIKQAGGRASVRIAVPTSISAPAGGIRMLEDGDEFCQVEPTGGGEKHAHI